VFCKLWGAEQTPMQDAVVHGESLARLSSAVGDSTPVSLPQPVDRKDA
jgi:hypothetical protein